MEEGVRCIVEAEIERIWLCGSTVHVGLSVPSLYLLVSPSTPPSCRPPRRCQPQAPTFLLVHWASHSFFFFSNKFVMQSLSTVDHEIAAKNRVRCFCIIGVADHSSHSLSLKDSRWAKATPSMDPGTPILVLIPAMPRYRLHLFLLLQILFLLL